MPETSKGLSSRIHPGLRTVTAHEQNENFQYWMSFLLLIVLHEYTINLATAFAQLTDITLTFIIRGSGEKIAH